MSSKSANSAVAANVLAAAKSQPTTTEPVKPAVPPAVQTDGTGEAETFNAQPSTPNIEPPPATEPPKGGTPNQPKPLLDAKGALTLDGKELLSERLAFAYESLGRGLRVILGNNLNPGQALRGQIENAFEAARKAANSSKATVKDLADAAAMQGTLATFLANHTLKAPMDLTTVRQEAEKSLAALKQLVPPA